LGDVVPDFTQESSHGPIKYAQTPILSNPELTLGLRSFYKYIDNNWAILFSHPRDYTPVCTTELGRAANLSSEWQKRGVKVLALSVDPVDSHKVMAL